jgi:hypothetical protein
MSSSQNNEGEIRAAMVEADVVECMVALPGQLFFNTQIPACLWFLAKKKTARPGEVLFIDARKLGRMISRVQAELTDEVIERIAATVAAWRGEAGAGDYADQPGYCRSVAAGRDCRARPRAHPRPLRGRRGGGGRRRSLCRQDALTHRTSWASRWPRVRSWMP